MALFTHGEVEGKLVTPFEAAINSATHHLDLLELYQILGIVAKFEEFPIVIRNMAKLEMSGQPEMEMLKVLNIAVRENDTAALQYFVDAGTSFEKGYEGDLPLNIAVFNNKFDIVEFIMSQGVSSEIKDWRGYTAMDYAIKDDNITMVAILQYWEEL